MRNIERGEFQRWLESSPLEWATTMRTSFRIPLLLVTIAAMLAAMAPHATALAQTGSQPAPDAGPGVTALHSAAEQGDVATLKQRLAAGDLVDARDDRGRTPLHRAAIAGQLKAAALLLDRGADPNARAEGEMTPLHFAAMLAHPELAGLLTRRGARTDIRNASGMMPLHLAANDEVVKVLAAAGADVNALTSKGMTPMHTARQGLVARALVDHKADLRIRTPRGRTSMETAGIETFERLGLSIHSVMLGRLRGIMGQMPVTLTNISSQAIRDLAISGRSQGCSVDVTPPSVAQLLPGQNADYILTLIRNPDVSPGVYPIYLALSADGSKIGDTDLKVDTSMSVTPQDLGMIRLAKGQIRPASSRWYYLFYAAVPILVVAAWLFFRRR
jgi:ankyrin repeat protein